MTKTTSPQKIKSKTNAKIKVIIKNTTSPAPAPTPRPTQEPAPTPPQNICICCHRNLGPGNPRQYCRKTYCDDLCVKCNDYCGGYC